MRDGVLERCDIVVDIVRTLKTFQTKKKFFLPLYELFVYYFTMKIILRKDEFYFIKSSPEKNIFRKNDFCLK
jgi:hypothetical protein